MRGDCMRRLVFEYSPYMYAPRSAAVQLYTDRFQPHRLRRASDPQLCTSKGC
eukprot:COSAG01_NODE_552_length_15569_cov_37.676123_5_plen_52_part_00